MAEVVPEEFNADYLRELMQAVKSLTKGYSVEITCKHCARSQKQIVQVPDFKQIVDSMTEFFNQAYGRPGVADSEASGTTIIVHRYWPGESDAESDPLPAAVDPA